MGKNKSKDRNIRHKRTRIIVIAFAVITLICVGIFLLNNPKSKNRDISLLNKDNTIAVMAQKSPLTVFTKEGKYEINSGTDLIDLLMQKKWKQKKESSQLELSPDLWIQIGENHEIRFYQSESLAMVLYNGDYRYYSVSKSLYSNLLDYIRKNGHKIVSEKITDTEKLDKIWDNYINDTICNIGNCQLFNSPKEIEASNIVDYCFNRYVAENGVSKLSQVGSGEIQGFLFPLKTVKEYAKRYFNIDEINVSTIGLDYYNKQKQSFVITREPRDKWVTKYNEPNHWGIHLLDVEKNTDGTYKVVMGTYDYEEEKRVRMTITYILKERSDGSLYFLSGRWDWINNNLVKITGDCEKFDNVEGYNGDLIYVRLAGDVNGKLLFYSLFNNKNNIEIMYIDKSTMSVTKSFIVSDYANADKDFFGIRIFDDDIVVKLRDKLIIVDKNLNSVKEKKISIKTKGEIKGYDVSSDLKRIVFSDDEGLKLIESENSSAKLLMKSEMYESPSGEILSFYFSPYFVADETKIVSTMSGYECTRGVFLYDIQSKDVRKVLDSGDSTTSGIVEDSGILEGNVYDSETNKVRTVYLDFKTGKLTEVPLKDTGYTGSIRDGSMCYAGKNYAAFVTYKMDYKDHANSMYYLNRLNLKTLELEHQIITVKAAEIHISGVTDDGQIIFYYKYNPGEKGVVVTKKR